jgi:protein O-GlcNAc transferase
MTESPSEGGQGEGADHEAAVPPGAGRMTPAQALELARHLYTRGRWDEAHGCCAAILEADGESYEALTLLGIITIGRGHAAEAQTLFARAVASRPDDPGAHLNHGSALRALKQFEAARDACNRALELAPDFADAFNNRGNTHHDLEDPSKALEDYGRAIQIRPDYAEAHNNRAGALHALGRLEEALDSCAIALRLRPDFADAYFNQGNAWSDSGRSAEALASYERALQLDPGHAAAYVGRGTLQRHLSQLEAAIESFTHALQIDPHLAEAYAGRGHALRLLARTEQARDDYRCALDLHCDQPGLYGAWLHSKAQLCDWTGRDTEIASAVADLGGGGEAISPFHALTIVDSARLQHRAAQTWTSNNCRSLPAPPVKGHRKRKAKLRIGYFSADFHSHATSRLLAGVIEAHDRKRFSTVAFSFGQDTQDEMRVRLSRAFDEFIPVRDLSDAAIALLSRSRGIDIAVDLKGHTHEQRMAIFSHRAAPIQVGYLGYPGTSGAPFMDYLIADRVLIPAQSRQHYSEKIVYMPFSYQANDRGRPIAHSAPSRSELGLPPAAFVFCCFNNGYKITPERFDVWMRILKRVPASVLWLLRDSDRFAENLRREAQLRGVPGERLIFAPRISMPEHLARHHAADLFLDTLPVNAHTTASDALWAGLPVLTQAGESMAARVVASLLNAVGLPELITASSEQFEAVAVELASDPQRAGAMREALQRNRQLRPLFDTDLFTSHLERAYELMFGRYRAKLGPEDLSVPP